MNRSIRATVLLIVAAAAMAAFSQGEAPKSPADPLATVQPEAPAEQVGMSAERLQRIHGAIQPYIDDGRLAGVVTLVARRGRLVHFEAQGLSDLEAKTPMRRDAIFRMASCSKPVTAVAVLMLMEEGKLRLSDPASRFIPEFTDLKVAIAKPGGEVDLVPAARPITIHDLLTHTSGLGSGGQLGRPAQGVGFGLSVEVVQDAVQAGWRRSNGSYGWDGAFGTIFWVDPKEQLIAVLLVQRSGRDVHHDFENAIMQAIVE